MSKPIDRINSLEEDIRLQELRLYDLIHEIQAECKHPLESIREGDHFNGDYVTLPPIRVCLECGYGEEGWGSGYKKLGRSSDVVANLPRDHILRHIKGRLHAEERDYD